ncbi:MAG: hypothetical protein MRJ65_16120 [Candidatus Brocadiaceae bacterium]|nr:hypothetical protein [Candidatus Brocadiaceae bacterium]
MKQPEHKLLYKLFRDHEDVIGESQTTILSLESLITSIKQLKCDKHEIKNQVITLFEVIKNSEPKIMPLINLVVSIEEEFVKNDVFKKESIEEIKNALISLFKKGIARYETTMEDVIRNGSALIHDNDLVGVYTASSLVLQSLVKAKVDEKKKFKALILKQDIVKTKQIVRTLQAVAIPIFVLSQHNLVHYTDYVSMVLLGAISVTRDGKFIAGAGTTSVVDICHLQKVPVYLIADTLKFSHLLCDEHHIHFKNLTEIHGDVELTYTQFSHDKVPLKHIDKIITEKGVINKEEIELMANG